MDIGETTRIGIAEPIELPADIPVETPVEVPEEEEVPA